MDASASSKQSVNIIETINEYHHKIYRLDFCSYNFFRYSRSGKWEIDVYLFMFKHNSDQCLLFCHDPLSHFTIDASSCMKV